VDEADVLELAIFDNGALGINMRRTRGSTNRVTMNETPQWTKHKEVEKKKKSFEIFPALSSLCPPLLITSCPVDGINDFSSMHHIAPWAQSWVLKAVSLDSSSIKVDFSFHRLLRDSLLQSASQISSLGSNAFLSYSRIIAILCLRRAEANSLPKQENWDLLKTLGTLFQIDAGYSTAFAYHIIELLKLQPNSANEDRNRLLIVFGRLIRDLSLPPSDIDSLVKSCISAIPKTSISTKSKELSETGGMWARIAATKFSIVPDHLIDELHNALCSISLTKLMASRNSIVHCINLIEMAYRFVLAMKSSNSHSIDLRSDLSRIHELVNSKIDVLKKFPNSIELKCRSMRAMAAINFENFFSSLKAVLEDSSGSHSTQEKKEALKSILRRMIHQPNNEALRKLAFSASQSHLSTHPQSALKELCSQISHLCNSYELNMGFYIPSDPIGINSFGISSSFFSAYDHTDSKTSNNMSPITFHCSESVEVHSDPHESSNHETAELAHPTLTLMAQFFEDMNSFDAMLETFNRYPMELLTKLELLADFPDQQTGPFLADLQKILQRQQQNPEEGSHYGLLQFVQKFGARPLPQRELIMSVLRSPKLLSNPLFLYHLSRVSLGLQTMSAMISAHHHHMMASNHAMMAPNAVSQQIPVQMIESDSERSDDPQSNLRKRKELALKMMDDLEQQESAPKRKVAEIPESGPNMDENMSLSYQPIEKDENLYKERLQDGGEATSLSTRSTRSKKAGIAKSTASAKTSTAKKASSATKGSKTSANGQIQEQLDTNDIESAGGGKKKIVAKKSSKASAATAKDDKKSGKKEKKEKKAEKAKKEQPRVICHHWIQHKCYKGDDCPFLHEGVQMTFDTICKFFRTGSCTKGAACPFSHDLKSEACFNMVSQGSCKFGDRCAYSHELAKINASKLVLEERRKQEDLEKEEKEKATQLPFAHHIIPFAPPMITGNPEEYSFSASWDQPSYIDPAETTHNDETPQSDSAAVESYTPPTNAPMNDSIMPAYIPPSITGLVGSILTDKDAKFSTPVLPTPLIMPTLAPTPPSFPLKPRSLLD
jgi:hypothetical protein